MPFPVQPFLYLITLHSYFLVWLKNMAYTINQYKNYEKVLKVLCFNSVHFVQKDSEERESQYGGPEKRSSSLKDSGPPRLF